MDFLKSAVANAISKGPPFPYSFADRVDVDQSIWTLHNGTKREDGSPCSIFSLDVAANRARLPLARNAVKKLRTLRHPGVIRVLDTVETDTYIYIATERVVPLRWHLMRKSLSPETIGWGLHGIATTVSFINNEAASIHGSVRASSVYTSESGEWKLAGFELVSSTKDDEAVIYTYGSSVPDAARHAPPELAQGGWDAVKKGPHTAIDSFGFGNLINEAYNGSGAGDQQQQRQQQPAGNIPQPMQTGCRRLMNPTPRARLTVGHFLEQGRRSGSFFDSPLIKLANGVERLGAQTAEERDSLLDDLDRLADDFPADFFRMKVLPELLKSVEFGGGGPRALAAVLRIGARLSDDEFDSRVTPVIIRLFGNQDRAVRVALLDSLPVMIDRLSAKVVNDKIFPQLVTGFADVAPVVREQTLKSVLVVVEKLSDRTINGELLRCLARTANDDQPGIRTNTTICLGKLARNLSNSTRAKVLTAAFLRSLRDPFVHARGAALMALAATVEHFSDEDCAGRILPAVCPLLLDKEPLAREQATKTLDVYLGRVRRAAAAMPAESTPAQAPAAAAAAAVSAPRMSTPQPGGSSWAGWAISSFTNKLSSAAGDMQTSDTPPPPPPAELAERQSPAPATAATAYRPSSPAVSTPPTVSRISSQLAAPPAVEDLWPAEEEENAGVDDDGWASFGDGAFAGAAESGAGAGGKSKSGATATVSASARPYDDGSEPDFAAWLAAKAEKNKPGARPLPKGLAKSSGGGSVAEKPTEGMRKTGGRKSSILTAKAAAKPAQKTDAIAKNTADGGGGDDDDGWGDNW